MKRMTLVEVGVVVQTSDPRLIGRACIGGGRKGQHGGDQTEAHESLQNNLTGHHYHSHPAADEGPGRNDRAFTSNHWSMSTRRGRAPDLRQALALTGVL